MKKIIKFLFTTSLFFCYLSIYAQTQQLSLRPLQVSDDAEQESEDGSVNVSSSDLELGGYDGSNQQIVGIRFPNVTLPANASILSAYIQFTVDETDTSAASIKIKAEIGDAATYTTEDYNISNRTYTSLSTIWNPTPWSPIGASTEAQRTSDLSGLIYESMQSSFTSGQALAFVFSSDSEEGKKVADPYAAVNNNGPELIIEYITEQLPVIDLTNVLVINEVTGSGTNLNNNDWVELYNTSNQPINLEGISISDDLDEPLKYQFTNRNLNSEAFVLIETDDFFGISANGETIYLFQTIDGNTVIIDSIEGRTTDNTSYGRQTDGSAAIVDFLNSTPGNSNNNSLEYIDLQFSQPRGLYMSGINLSLSANGDTIKYTTDFTTPSPTNGIVYNGPININNNVVIKAFAYSNVGQSKVITNTYVINDRSEYQQIPIASISTINDIDSGTERGCTFEFINTYGENDSQYADAGFNKFGNFSASEDKTNFRVHFRAEYGVKRFKHKVFEQDSFSEIEPTESFNALDFRSGQDATGNYLGARTMMSEVTTRLQSRSLYNIDVHARYSHLFINGQYWGVYALREQFNHHWMEDYYGGDDDDYDAYTGGDAVSSFPNSIDAVNGTEDNWDILEEIAHTDFQAIKERLNVEHYINYMLIYFIGDFESEFRCATSRDLSSAKMQFYHNDLDGAIRPDTDDGLASHLDKLDIDSGHGPGELFWLANMGGTNLEYETMVKDRILEVFDENSDAGVLSVNGITKTVNQVRAQLRTFNALEYERWGYSNSQQYEADINAYLAYLPTRIGDVLNFLDSRELVHNYNYTSYSEAAGDLEADAAVTIINPNPNTVVYYSIGGDDVVFDNAPSGILYAEGSALPLVEGINIIKSRAYSNGNFGPLKEVVYNVKSDLNITGINYKPLLEGELADEDEEDYEFVLVTNNAAEARNVAGYFFDGFNFEFPEGAVIGAEETVMIVKNLNIYPSLTYNRFLWSEGGKLKNSGEELTWTTDTNEVINQLTYDDENPWPEAADGNGAYLKLIENDLDNTIAENWEAVALPNVISLLSTQEFIIENEVTIFPVPVNNVLTVSLKKNRKISAVIYDVSGKRLLQVNETNNSELKIDISNFSSGIYILSLDVDNTRVLRKILKN